MTTASERLVPAAAEGLGRPVACGEASVLAVGPVLGRGDGVGNGFSQATSRAAITAAARPRRTGLDAAGRREGDLRTEFGVPSGIDMPAVTAALDPRVGQEIGE